MVSIPIPSSLNDYANLIALYDNDMRYLPARRSALTTSRRSSPPYKALEERKYTDLATKVPREYYNLLHVFS
ncbi:hypothetical protein K458DRAFT_397377 [Lentithecium fluviatile CBS 122367]|uniref:Uncharacterized protein n=1 Tax=Lentithecium fluviatile CBS 122367 TaxID=1168545 RepID=A0A6G1IDS0_9PLEO|nr:hypothetical protein K458DRAFT_397377 [Lentithecium fluviatile CBS 122367]